MVLAVVGPGAVGGLLAGLAVRAGEDVVAVGRPATIARLAREGITVRSNHFGDFHAGVPTIDQVPTGADVLLTVKSYGLPGVLEQLRASDPASVLAVLNGVDHPPQLRTALPGSSVASASVTVEAVRDVDGVVVHRSPFLELTVPDEATTWPSVQALGQAGVEIVPGGSEQEVLWRKFRFLAPLALLTSYWDTDLGRALARDPQLTAGVIAETAQVASQEGLPTDAVELAGILASLPQGMRSSLQRDLAAGAATELDALGGSLVRLAARHDIPLPTVALVVAELLRRPPGSAKDSPSTAAPRWPAQPPVQP